MKQEKGWIKAGYHSPGRNESAAFCARTTMAPNRMHMDVDMDVDDVRNERNGRSQDLERDSLTRTRLRSIARAMDPIPSHRLIMMRTMRTG